MREDIHVHLYQTLQNIARLVREQTAWRFDQAGFSTNLKIFNDAIAIALEALSQGTQAAEPPEYSVVYIKEKLHDIENLIGGW
ncbi:hypothetical protein [Huginn virus]|nr:hypothetical protein [Huginn virus]